MAKTQKKSAALTIEPRPIRKPMKILVKAPRPQAKSTKAVPSSPPLSATETVAESMIANALPAAGDDINQIITDTVAARSSKQATLITLMRRAEGATLNDLISATGWQRHSVRGAISGAVKKRLGFVIASSVEDRGRVYRIAGERR